MIVYNRLWKTMKEKGISQYTLINVYGFSSATISALKHNKNMETETLSRLCGILKCRLSDIAEEADFPEDSK